MKKSTLTLIIPCLLLFIGCSDDQPIENPLSINPIFKVFDDKVDHFVGRETDACFEVILKAGQYHDAGYVTVDVLDVDGDGILDVLVITYTADEGWTINATHLSIGDCEEQTFPTTGSGNPKVGQFEHSSDHPEGTNEVVYTISIEAIGTEFCFAAHAELTGPTGQETGWANGVNFDGNSWAMYVEALLEGCTGDGGPVQK